MLEGRIGPTVKLQAEEGATHLRQGDQIFGLLAYAAQDRFHRHGMRNTQCALPQDSWNARVA